MIPRDKLDGRVVTHAVMRAMQMIEYKYEIITARLVEKNARRGRNRFCKFFVTVTAERRARAAKLGSRVA